MHEFKFCLYIHFTVGLLVRPHCTVWQYCTMNVKHYNTTSIYCTLRELVEVYCRQLVSQSVLRTVYLFGNTVLTENLLGNSLLSEKLLGNTILPEKLLGNSILPENLLTNTVLSENLLAQTVLPENL